MKQLAAIQLAGNAAALWLFYYWLSIGEARAGLLVWSACVGLFTAALFVWIHGAGLAYGRDPYRSPFAVALGALPALLAVSAAILLLYLALGWMQDALHNPSFRLASWLTLKLRKPMKPAWTWRVVTATFWTLRWVVLPVVLMPWVRSVAANGFHGLFPAKWPLRTWMERALTPVLLICAIYLPLHLLAWRPLMEGFAIEMTSFILRGLLAYLLFAGGLLMLEGMPLFAQRKRVVSP